VIQNLAAKTHHGSQILSHVGYKSRRNLWEFTSLLTAFDERQSIADREQRKIFDYRAETCK
jgi:hypothetical protein